MPVTVQARNLTFARLPLFGYDFLVCISCFSRKAIPGHKMHTHPYTCMRVVSSNYFFFTIAQEKAEISTVLSSHLHAVVCGTNEKMLYFILDVFPCTEMKRWWRKEATSCTRSFCGRSSLSSQTSWRLALQPLLQRRKVQ